MCWEDVSGNNKLEHLSRRGQGVTLSLAPSMPFLILPRENEGTETEAPGPALGICHVQESYF